MRNGASDTASIINMAVIPSFQDNRRRDVATDCVDVKCWSCDRFVESIRNGDFHQDPVSDYSPRDLTHCLM
jgi:hypothetical protein